MKQFRKNVLRLAVKNIGALLGAALMIALGVFVMISMEDTLRNLRGQISSYYNSQHLADAFAKVSGISEAELLRLRSIPGIAEVSGKMSAELRLVADGQEEIVTVHLLSYSPETSLNRPRLSAPFTGETDIFLGPRMAAVFQYAPGTALQLLRNGESFRFQYAGIVSQPDYIYSVPPGGAMVPDGSVYDIAMISAVRMRAILGTAALSELAFTLSPGYRYEDVRHALTERLEPFGLKELCSAGEQLSWEMVDSEFHELRTTGTVLPALFLSVSVFMLYVVLKKMIDRDQVLIGTMKAMGLSNRELISAYLTQGLLIGIAGATLGGLTAGFFGRYMFSLYCDYFNLPDPVYRDLLQTRIFALLLSVSTALAAVLSGILRILSIAPAAAMRQPAPSSAPAIRPPAWLRAGSSYMTRLSFHALTRNPFRGFLLVLSVAFPFALASVFLSYPSIVEKMLRDQFERTESYDIQVQLDRHVRPLEALSAGISLRAAAEAEAVCRLTVSCQKDSQTEYSVLNGLNRGSRLWNILDSEGRTHVPPEDGLLMNRRLAERLHVSAGDNIQLLIPGLFQKAKSVRVKEIIPETFGGGCYLSLSAFPELLGIDSAADRLLLRAAPGQLRALKEELLDANRVSWIVDMRKTRQSYRRMTGAMYIMMNAFSLMAVLAGGILIYNISLINLRERLTELVTLRVLGSSEEEIARMILTEHGLLFAAGILLGLPGNFAVRKLLEKIFMTSKSYSFRLALYPGGCAAAFVCCALITFIAWRREMKVFRSFRLTDALKERE